jgi:hypothetical protein
VFGNGEINHLFVFETFSYLMEKLVSGSSCWHFIREIRIAGGLFQRNFRIWFDRGSVLVPQLCQAGHLSLRAKTKLQFPLPGFRTAGGASPLSGLSRGCLTAAPSTLAGNACGCSPARSAAAAWSPAPSPPSARCSRHQSRPRRPRIPSRGTSARTARTQPARRRLLPALARSRLSPALHTSVPAGRVHRRSQPSEGSHSIDFPANDRGRGLCPFHFSMAKNTFARNVVAHFEDAARSLASSSRALVRGCFLRSTIGFRLAASWSGGRASGISNRSPPQKMTLQASQTIEFPANDRGRCGAASSSPFPGECHSSAKSVSRAAFG